MKKCNKCNLDYSNDINFCKKCGNELIYFESEEEKAKRELKLKQMQIEKEEKEKKKKETVDFLRYFIGIVFIIINIPDIPNLYSFIGILFGISLLPCTYSLIKKKNISEYITKLCAVLIPILLFLLWVPLITNDTENSYNENNNNNNNKSEKNDTETKLEYPTYELKFDRPGDFGKLVEYEGDKAYFYYFPEGEYTVKVTYMGSTICCLYNDYNKPYTTEWGTTYNLKEKYIFTEKNEIKTIVITNDTHIYNSGKCNYKFTSKKAVIVNKNE